jgi:hypothetical protein
MTPTKHALIAARCARARILARAAAAALLEIERSIVLAHVRGMQ